MESRVEEVDDGCDDKNRWLVDGIIMVLIKIELKVGQIRFEGDN